MKAWRRSASRRPACSPAWAPCATSPPAPTPTCSTGSPSSSPSDAWSAISPAIRACTSCGALPSRRATRSLASMSRSTCTACGRAPPRPASTVATSACCTPTSTSSQSTRPRSTSPSTWSPRSPAAAPSSTRPRPRSRRRPWWAAVARASPPTSRSILRCCPTSPSPAACSRTAARGRVDPCPWSSTPATPRTRGSWSFVRS